MKSVFSFYIFLAAVASRRNFPLSGLQKGGLFSQYVGAIMFGADKRRASCGLLGGSIRTSTDRDAIMSSPAGDGDRSGFCAPLSKRSGQKGLKCPSQWRTVRALRSRQIYASDKSGAAAPCLEPAGRAVKVSGALYVTSRPFWRLPPLFFLLRIKSRRFFFCPGLWSKKKRQHEGHKS